ncbi:MAG: CvpA family protein [Christensenellaceae bacterium]|jgi:uncharacterized membrane protein required for colicin V production|nr:CvpA family protein [Christensenellaceae bacterium]
MSVPIIIDIVFVALVAILAIIGLIKGFAQSALSLIGSFVSIVLAILVAKPFGALINAIFGSNGFFGGKIAEVFYGFNDVFGMVQTGGLTATEAYNTASAAKGGIFDFLYKYIFADHGVAPGGTLGGAIGDVLGPLATIVLAAIIAFILIRIIVAILSSLMKRLTEFSIIGGIDKVLGFIFGAAKGLLFTAFVCAMLSALTIVFPSISDSTRPILDDTKIVKIVYDKTDELTRDYLGNKLRDFANSILGEEEASGSGEETSGARPNIAPVLRLTNQSNTLIEICNYYLPKYNNA